MHPVNSHGLARTSTEIWAALDLQEGAALPCSERVTENRALKEAALLPEQTVVMEHGATPRRQRNNFHDGPPNSRKSRRL